MSSVNSIPPDLRFSPSAFAHQKDNLGASQPRGEARSASNEEVSGKASAFQGPMNDLSSPMSGGMVSSLYSSATQELPSGFLEQSSDLIAKKIALDTVKTMGLPPANQDFKKGAQWFSEAKAFASRLAKQLHFGSQMDLNERIRKEFSNLRYAFSQSYGKGMEAYRGLQGGYWDRLSQLAQLSAQLQAAQGKKQSYESLLASLDSSQHRLANLESSQEEAKRQGLALAALLAAAKEAKDKEKKDKEDVDAIDDIPDIDALPRLKADEDMGSDQDSGYESNGEEEEDKEEGLSRVFKGDPSSQFLFGDDGSTKIERLLKKSQKAGVKAAMNSFYNNPVLTDYNQLCNLNTMVIDAIILIVMAFLRLASLIDKSLMDMLQNFQEQNNKLQDLSATSTNLGNISSTVADADVQVNLFNSDQTTWVTLVGRPDNDPTKQGQKVPLIEAICAYGLASGVPAATSKGGATDTDLCQGYVSGHFTGATGAWISGKQASQLLENIRQKNQTYNNVSQTQMFQLQDMGNKRSAAFDAASSLEKRMMDSESRQIQNV